MRYFMRRLRQFLSSFRSRPKTAWEGQSLETLLHGYRATALLYVAAKLKIADHLAHGSQTSQQLAKTLNAHEPALHRILRGLVVLGFCTETGDQFQLTSLGKKFRSTSGRSEYHQAILNGEEYATAWNHLLESAMTGKTAFDLAFGESPWEHRQKNPELNEHFNVWLESGAAAAGWAIAAAHDFSRCRVVADIGGNEGSLLISILQASPSTRGILMDQSHVIAAAQKRLNAAGLQSRCEIVGGNFFEAIPPGADVYILKSILHDWDDEKCRLILKNCGAVMKPGQSLLVAERIRPARVKDHPATIMSDLHMLAVTGGQERTVEQYQTLFTAAGFALQKTNSLKTGHSLMEAVKT